MKGFLAPFVEIGFSESQAREIVEKLTKAYEQPHRAYHTMDHIISCLALLARYRAHTTRYAELAVALWYHDVVYVTNRNDNEEQSALMWEEDSRGIVDQEIRQRIASDIRATAEHKASADPDTALMMDIDMSILGADPVIFEEYDSQIRREYWWVPVKDYNFLRARVLRGFLDSPIYTTVPFIPLQQQATENLTKKAIELDE